MNLKLCNDDLTTLRLALGTYITELEGNIGVHTCDLVRFKTKEAQADIRKELKNTKCKLKHAYLLHTKVQKECIKRRA